MTVVCSRGTPTADDLDKVRRFGLSLQRLAAYGKHPGSVELLFDGDAALVLPDMVDRGEYAALRGWIGARVVARGTGGLWALPGVRRG